MSINKRKIGFYSLQIREIKTDRIVDPTILKNIIISIAGLPKNQRILEFKSKNKFHMLFSQKFDINNHNIIFASAKYNHRPPLIDKNTAGLRDNPKFIYEGEQENTHIALKYLKDEIVLLLEERTVGITIKNLAYYLSYFLNRINSANNSKYQIEYSLIPKEDFQKEFEKLKKVKVCEVHVTKQILGSEFLDFAERTETIKNDIVITIKPIKGMSIKNPSSNIVKKYFGKDKKINKIRILGESKSGNKVLLDTEVIKMIEYVEVDINEVTGIINSDNIFPKINNILDKVK